mmetsp:Transcript_52034/g.103555  ORF Transcript_52034/g.103555 Transcript_52034/m.103555 type:complete len:80 (+) Transcript_52034:300-539(+)
MLNYARSCPLTSEKRPKRSTGTLSAEVTSSAAPCGIGSQAALLLLESLRTTCLLTTQLRLAHTITRYRVMLDKDRWSLE